MKQEGNPWWREPWPWLLMSGPLLAMVACGITIWLAATHPDKPIVEGVSSHGLVIDKVEVAPANVPARPVAARRP